jgi:hypothetical protein
VATVAPRRIRRRDFTLRAKTRASLAAPFARFRLKPLGFQPIRRSHKKESAEWAFPGRFLQGNGRVTRSPVAAIVLNQSPIPPTQPVEVVGVAKV